MNNLPKYKIYETVWFFDPYSHILPIKGVIHSQPIMAKKSEDNIYYISSKNDETYVRHEKECYRTFWAALFKI